MHSVARQKNTGHCHWDRLHILILCFIGYHLVTAKCKRKSTLWVGKKLDTFSFEHNFGINYQLRLRSGHLFCLLFINLYFFSFLSLPFVVNKDVHNFGKYCQILILLLLKTEINCDNVYHKNSNLSPHPISASALPCKIGQRAWFRN